jgi:hypothetical protein
MWIIRRVVGFIVCRFIVSSLVRGLVVVTVRRTRHAIVRSSRLLASIFVVIAVGIKLARWCLFQEMARRRASGIQCGGITGLRVLLGFVGLDFLLTGFSCLANRGTLKQSSETVQCREKRSVRRQRIQVKKQGPQELESTFECFQKTYPMMLVCSWKDTSERATSAMDTKGSTQRKS